MTLTALLIAAVLPTAGIGAPPGAAISGVFGMPGAQEPQVEVWTNRQSVLLRGDQVRVYFRTESDAYVTVFQVDTDGVARVLFPAGPWDNNYIRGRQEAEIRAYGQRYTFLANEYPGQGFLFAVASRDPFDYSQFVSGGQWDYRFIGLEGRIVGDPYAAFMDVIDAIVPPNYADYEYDTVLYNVGQSYAYPRFVCYDCHEYAPYPVWDPYVEQCVPFGVTVYNDPYYYPVRDRRGTDVVFTGRRLEARYVITKRHPAEPYVRMMERHDEPGTRSAQTTRRVTGRDVGGVGTVPTPEASRRTLGQESSAPSLDTASAIAVQRRAQEEPAPSDPSLAERVRSAWRAVTSSPSNAQTEQERVRSASEAAAPVTGGRQRPTLERRTAPTAASIPAELPKPDSTAGDSINASRPRPDTSAVDPSRRESPPRR